MSIRELHNRLVSDPNDGGIKDARDEHGKTFIRDSTFFSLLTTKSKQISARYMIMYGCECCICAKGIHSSLLSWSDRYLKKQNIKSRMLKVKVQ